MKAVISIAARTASTRLPEKVLSDLSGVPMLGRLIDRLALSGIPVCVATTGAPEDERIMAVAKKHGAFAVRGHPSDLIARHAAVVEHLGADYVLLAGADDPLLDWRLFRVVLERLKRGDVDYVKTAGWPLGLNVWGWTAQAMHEANVQATAYDEREHVVPFWERRNYRRDTIQRPNRDLYDVYRVTVDNESDMRLIRALHAAGAFGEQWSADEIVEYLDQHPEVAALNADGMRGTAARDAIYRIEPVLDDLDAFLAVERRAAQAAIPEQGMFAEGRAAAILTIQQWRSHRAS